MTTIPFCARTQPGIRTLVGFYGPLIIPHVDFIITVQDAEGKPVEFYLARPIEPDFCDGDYWRPLRVYFQPGRSDTNELLHRRLLELGINTEDPEVFVFIEFCGIANIRPDSLKVDGDFSHRLVNEDCLNLYEVRVRRLSNPIETAGTEVKRFRQVRPNFPTHVQKALVDMGFSY